MKAAVIHEAGGPEVLKIETRPLPRPQAGEVLIRVKAFGLNRSELFTRQGHSPGVKFPRILGIEAAGIVEEAPGHEFGEGDIVATAMGGMGRNFDGGYAEYTCVPAAQSAAAIAKSYGVFVAATTRNPEREKILRQSGAGQVFIDAGSIAGHVRDVYPVGVDKVLEMVGTATLKDSLRCVKPRGIVCMTGIVGNKWSFDNFSPMEAIPTAVYLTAYSGGAEEFMQTPLEELAGKISAGTLHVQRGKVFRLEEIDEAHRCMEENKAGGKIVVLT